VGSIYSGVVSLRACDKFFYSRAKWISEFGSECLKAKTQVQIYIIAGSEFGALEGCILVVRKALYGLGTYGLRWHERFASCLAEPDLWMFPAADHSFYERIAVNVDDLAIGR
jgi:hypothetical protein